MKIIALCVAITAALITNAPAPDFNILDEAEPEVTYTEDELFCLAAVIYNEAGGDACCDECRYRVGDVVLNRVADGRFGGDTIREVLEEPGQYGMASGVRFAARSENAGEAHAVERAYETARQLLSGERHSELYGEGYVWQATFRQGSDNVYCCGQYFGR